MKLASIALVTTLASISTAHAQQAAASSTSTAQPSKDIGLYSIELEGGLEFLDDQPDNTRSVRGYLGYAGELSRHGRWRTFYGVGFTGGTDLRIDPEAEYPGGRRYWGAEARIGIAAVVAPYKVFQTHLFVSALSSNASQSPSKDGFTYRVGATVSLSTMGKLFALVHIADNTGGDGDDGESNGMYTAALLAVPLGILPTTVSVFVEDTPSSDGPKRYGLGLGWSL